MDRRVKPGRRKRFNVACSFHLLDRFLAGVDEGAAAAFDAAAA
jgi:hypothetical protein